MYSHFISALRIYLYFILIPQTQDDSLLSPPSPKEKYYKVMYFYKVGLAVIVFFAETVQNQLEPNNNPELIRDSESRST